MMSLSKKYIFLFETIKIQDSVAWNLNYHNDRIVRSIGKLPNFNLEKILSLDKPGLFRAKVIYDLNGDLVNLEFHTYKMKEFRDFHLVNIDFDYDKKYFDRNGIDTAKSNFDEIIMVKNSLITDTSIANLAVYKNSHWFTPKTPLLFGTTRQRLLNENKIIEGDLSVNDLLNAKRLAIFNAMIGFYEVQNFKIFY